MGFLFALIAEVLSPAKALKDRHAKFSIYEQQAVLYYLIIDADKKTVEIYILKNGKYAIEDSEGIFSFTFDKECTAGVSFSNLFIT